MSQANFRKYTTIYSSDNVEYSYGDIHLGYLNDFHTFSFQPDKTTWFRTPNIDFKPINLNETGFFQNGGVAGQSPLLSDKIFKKLDNSSNKENTGVWLCSWLSGGPDRAIWMDRYYIPPQVSQFEALNYDRNYNYTPQFKELYEEGIKDYVSSLTIEKNSTYAYSRIGKKAGSSFLDGISDKLLYKGIQQYKNVNDSDITVLKDKDNDDILNFTGNSWGKVNVKDFEQEINNFTFSFYLTRKDWNESSSYQILGNYVNGGFGLFNNQNINPIIFNYTDTVLSFYNKNYIEILKLDLKTFTNIIHKLRLKIINVVYTSLTNNFYVLTNGGFIFEFDCNGTLLDYKDLDNFDVYSSSYNYNYAALYVGASEIVLVNLKNKEYNYISSYTNINANLNDNFDKKSILIDYLDRVFIFEGSNPIIKEEKIYFIDDTKEYIKCYNIYDQAIKDLIYLENEEITSFDFNKEGKLFVCSEKVS